MKTSGFSALALEEPQDLLGVDSDLDDVEAMIMGTLLVDDEEMWYTEAVGGNDVLTMEDDPRVMVVDGKHEA